MDSDPTIHRDSVPSADSIDEGLAVLLVCLANAYRDSGMNFHAAAVAEAAIALDDGDPGPTFLMVHSLHRMGHDATALQWLGRLAARTDLDKVKPWSLAEAAEAALDLGDAPTARALASRAIDTAVHQQDTSNAQAMALVVMGRIAAIDRDVKGAIRAFEAAVRAEPTFPDSYPWHAWALMLDGRSEDARAVLECAVRRGVANGTVYRQLARDERAKSSSEEARYLLLRAARAGDSEAIDELCLNEGWEVERSWIAIGGENARSQGGDEGEADPYRHLASVAWFLYAHARPLTFSHPARAIRHLRAALVLAPDVPHVLRDLGLALGNVGDTAEAVVHLRRASQLFEDPSASLEASVLAAWFSACADRSADLADIVAAARQRWPDMAHEAPALAALLRACQHLGREDPTAAARSVAEAYETDRSDPTAAWLRVAHEAANSSLPIAEATVMQVLETCPSAGVLFHAVGISNPSERLQRRLMAAYLKLRATGGDATAAALLRKCALVLGESGALVPDG